jgi:hypothetical protein
VGSIWSVLSIWFIWLVSFVWLNQINQIDPIDEIDQINQLLQYVTEYADIQTMTGIDLPIEFREHHFSNNLLELFYATCLAKDLIQRILSSP